MAIIWMIAFAVLVIVETQTLEFTCLSIALGCLLAATAAWVGLALGWQLAIAAVGGGVGVGLLAPFLRRRLIPADMRTGNDLLVGAEAIVTEAIRPPAEGKVKLNGVVWQAVSDRPIAEGAVVYVTEVLGAKLSVMARTELEPGETRALATPQEERARPEPQREQP